MLTAYRQTPEVSFIYPLEVRDMPPGLSVHRATRGFFYGEEGDMSEGKVPCACGCGTEIAAVDRWGAPHRFAKGHHNRLRVRANNPRWKGGRYIDSENYVRLLMPDDPRQIGGYVREHIVIWEAAHGPMPQGHVIHHKNGDKQDNRLENLEMMTVGQHKTLHNIERYRR